MPDELELLRGMGRDVAEPEDGSVDRARGLLKQRIEKGDTRQRTRPNRLGIRSRLAFSAVALVLGGVLGFGVAGSFAPSGSATSFVGFGFLPAQGWSVSQTGVLDATGVARAVAANIPIDPRDDLRGEPRATLRELPPRGVVISATFTPRGDAEVDATYPVRHPPLLLEDAERVAPARFELRAGIRGYNVVLAIHFGSDQPSSRLLAAAQRQLDRLIVAAERVTIFVRPPIAGSLQTNSSVTIYGSIDSDEAGETVEIHAKTCQSSFFRLVTGTTTASGGSWSTRYTPGINTTVRAIWNDVSSPQVAIRARPWMSLRKNRDGETLKVAASGRRSFWRKRVEIQRRDPRLGTWKRVQVVVLTDTHGNRGSGPGAGATTADFKPAVPKGTVLRAVMPLSQTKPCHLSGTSNTLRT